MKNSFLMKCLLIGVVSSVSALADMTVDKSNGILNISSDKSGMVVAKIIGPNNEVIINTTYEGNSFSWSPSAQDGAYRYDVRIQGDYAGGSLEVINGQIQTTQDEG
jgi:hypothetical protein